jgi:uncharacterized coiled-coil DUF342 family protein
MPVMLERWNDDKMDALAGKVDDVRDQGRDLREDFHDLRGDFRDLRKEFRELGHELGEHRKETKDGFETLHRMLVQTAVAVLTSFIVGVAALIGLIATQM